MFAISPNQNRTINPFKACGYYSLTQWASYFSHSVRCFSLIFRVCLIFRTFQWQIEVHEILNLPFKLDFPLKYCPLCFVFYVETWAHLKKKKRRQKKPLITLGQAIKLSTYIYHCRGTDNLKLKKNCYVLVLFDINTINICEYFLYLFNFTMQVCTRVDNGVFKKLTSVLVTMSDRLDVALWQHEASMCIRFRKTCLSLLWSSCNDCGWK